MTIGEQIRYIRKHLGLTQKELGDLSGTSETTIKQYELGKRQPRIEQLQKIATALGGSISEIFNDNYLLSDTDSEILEKRARFVGNVDPQKPPLFTVPMSNESDKRNNSSTANTLDENYFIHILQKEERGQKLTQKEKNYKSFFLSETLRGIGNKFADYYLMLNEEGQKKADEEINRTLEFLMLISQVPEYQRKEESED